MPRRTLLLLAGLAAVLYKLWLVEVHDLYMVGSPMDDLYFVRTAHQLLLGNWLGPYTQYTLMSGPVYALWIALCYLLAIPLHLGQQLLYAGASLVAVLALVPAVRRRGWLLLAFVFLLFNPFTYDYSSSAGAFRLGIYPALALLVVSCSIGLYVRVATVGRPAWPWAVGLGAALAAFWYTREEGLWMFPALGVSAVLLLAAGWRRLGGRRLAGLLLLPPALLVAAGLTLGYLNWRHYGIFTDVEIKSGAFKSAYAALLRVQDPPPPRYQLMPPATIQALADVSPAFREIAPYMRQLPASVFIWGFRDAVQAAGYYDHNGPDDRENGPKTLDFYARLGRELRQACAQARIRCSRSPMSFLPPWRPEYTRDLWDTFRSITRMLVSFEGFEPRMLSKWISRDPYSTSWLFTYITGERLRPTRRALLAKIPEAHVAFQQLKTHRLLRIGRDYYQNLVPWLFYPAVGLILVAAAVEAAGRRLAAVTGAGLIALAALLTHLVMLTVVAVTALFAQRYLSASYPLVILIVVIGVVEAVRLGAASWSWWRGRHPAATP